MLCPAARVVLVHHIDDHVPEAGECPRRCADRILDGRSICEPDRGVLIENAGHQYRAAILQRLSERSHAPSVVVVDLPAIR